MKTALSAALDTSAASATDQRMSKTLSTLSKQARQHPKLSELLGLNVADLCGSGDTEAGDRH